MNIKGITKVPKKALGNLNDTSLIPKISEGIILK